MNNLRVAYFSHDSILEGVGRSQILSLCRELSKEGVVVTLFSFEKNSPSVEFEKLLADYSIDWKWYPFVKGGTFPAIRRINILRQVHGDFDLIHARGDLPAFAAVLRKSEPVIWDIRSLWADQKKVLNPEQFNVVARKILGLINQYTSNRISAYNTLTDAIIDGIRVRYPKLPLNFSVVSTCVDTKLFTFEPNFPQNPVGLLSGTYNSIYDSELIRKFTSYVIEKFGHKVLWIRGSEGGDKFADLGQQEIISSTYDNVAYHIAQSSYGISICRNNLGDSLKAAMPTKIAEFLSVGRPVIVNSSLGDVQNLLIKNRVAVKLDYEDEIPEAAKRLIALISDIHAPARCREIAEKYFSLNYAVKQYTSLYRLVASQRS